MKRIFALLILLLPLSAHAQTIINQEYVQQWQAQPASPGLPVYNNCYLYLDQTTHLLIGINSDGTYCLTPGGGGGGGTTLNPGTPYQVTRYDAAGTNIEDSTGSDNPSNGPTEWVSGLSVENNAGYRAFSNSPTGTSTNLLVCLDSTVTTLAEVTTCAVSSTSVLGLADNGAGSTGTVRVAMFGFHSCVFDNQTVIGDWVVPSTSVEGDCSDAGASKPSGVQVLGHATSLNTGAATLGTVDLFTGDTIAPGGGGNPVTINPCVQVGCDAYYVMTNVVGGDPNTNDDGNGNKQSKSVGLTDSSQSGFWYSQAGPALPSLDGLNRFYFSVNTAFGTTYGLEPWDNAPTTGHCVDIAAGDAAGYVKLHDTGAGCGTGAGSVTSLTATLPIVATPSPITTTGVFSCPTCLTGISTGNLSPLFTASFSASTTPVLSFTLSNAAANTVFGNFTNSSGAPSYNAVSACGDSTHALKWTAGTGFGCQTISVGATTEVQVNGVDTTAQTPINFINSATTFDGYTITESNPSAGSIKPALTTPNTQASNPVAPTVTQGGSAGATSDTYGIVGCEDVACTGHSAISSTGSTSTANATLTTSNYNLLSAYADTLYGYRFYIVCRLTAGGTPSSTGVIASGAGKAFRDTGGVGDGTNCASVYASNTTVLSPACFASFAPGGNSMPGAPCGTDAPPLAPVTDNDEMTAQYGAPGDTNDGVWARLNISTCTDTWTGGTLSVSCPTGAGTAHLSCVEKVSSLPVAPYTYIFSLYMPFTVSVTSHNDDLGVGFYEAATGKIQLVGNFNTSANNKFAITSWNNSFTADTQTFLSDNNYVPYNQFSYWKVQNDASHLNYYTSPDGITYGLVYQSPLITTFFTTAPDHIVMCVNANTGAADIDVDYVRRTQ